MLMSNCHGRRTGLLRAARPSAWLAVCLLAPISLQASEKPGHAVMTVSQVRNLPSEQAGKSAPVHLSGVVTVPSTYKNSFFFMDSTGSISVDRMDESARPMRAGERVEIEGETAPGLFAPVVLAKQVKVIGQQELPQPRLFRPEELASGREDSQWVGLRAQVRFASIQSIWGNEVLVLRANTDLGTIAVQVRDFSKGGWDQLPGAVVVIRGVCGSIFNDRRQLVGIRLFVASLDDLQVVKPGLSSPFDLPLSSPDSLLRFNGGSQSSDPVKVRGTVTYAVPNDFFFIQSGQRGLLARAARSGPIAVGSTVDVVGYPESGNYAPVINDAIYRIVPGSAPVTPAPAAASMIVLKNRGFWAAPYDGTLVRLTGTVVYETQEEIQDQLILRDRDVVFRSKLSGSDGHLQRLAPGTVVSVTGVCAAHIDDVRNVQYFEVLLRSPSDIVIVKTVPWWRDARAGWMVALILSGVFIISTIAFLLKHHFELRALAMKDPLTNLLNRRGFAILARRMWREAVRNEVTLLLIYVDIDRFKEINDLYGHHSGDRALIAVAEVLRQCLRPEDVCARMGGDEFAAFCAMPESVFDSVEQRIRTKLESHPSIRERGFSVDISIGVLVCKPSLAPVSVEELIRRADGQMYDQKRRRQAAAHEASKTTGVVSRGSAEGLSGERANAFALDDIQQLQRRPAWPLLPNLPLLNGRDAGVQHGGERRLTDPTRPL